METDAETGATRGQAQEDARESAPRAGDFRHGIRCAGVSVLPEVHIL